MFLRGCPLPPNQRADGKLSRSGLTSSLIVATLRQLEPIESVWVEGEQVGQLTDPRESLPAQHLDRKQALVLRQIKLCRLRPRRQVIHAQDDVFPLTPDVSEDRR